MNVNKTMFGARPQLIVSDDISKNPTVIYFGCGAGENNSDGTTNKLDALYVNGSPFQMAKDGLLKDYVVIGLQGINGLAPNTWEVLAAVKALKAKGTNGIVVCTGLSAGGQLTCDVRGADTERIFTAYVEMSTPGTQVGDWGVAKGRGKLLAFHGALDGGITAYLNSVNIVKAINAVEPGTAFLITKPGEGHSGWANNYGSKFPIPGFGTTDWLTWASVTSLNPTQLFTATGTEGSGGGTTPPPVATTPTKAVPVIRIVNGTAVLNSNTSVINQKQGSFENGSWKITPAAGTGAIDVGADFADKTVAGFKTNTTYTVSLTVRDHLGASSVVSVSLTTDATGSYNPGVVVVPDSPVVLPEADPVIKVYTMSVHRSGKIDLA